MEAIISPPQKDSKHDVLKSFHFDNRSVSGVDLSRGSILPRANFNTKLVSLPKIENSVNLPSYGKYIISVHKRRVEEEKQKEIVRKMEVAASQALEGMTKDCETFWSEIQSES